MSTVFVNGEYLEVGAARLSAFDAGVQHGVGLFETMRASRSGDDVRVERLSGHVERIVASARDLGLSDNIRSGPLEEAVIETVRRSDLGEARVRLTITGGNLNLLQTRSTDGRPMARHDPTILIVPQPATTYPAEMFEKGVRVVIANARSNPLNPFEGHKTLNYWWRLRELQEAAGRGAGEGLIFSVSNHLCGGCVSNVMIIKGRQLLTPIARGEEQEIAGDGAALPSPVLPGITRRAVLDRAAEQGFEIERRMLSIDDVLGSDEVFLTNSSWFVMPVVAVEAEPIADGKVGAFARQLLEAN